MNPDNSKDVTMGNVTGRIVGDRNASTEWQYLEKRPHSWQQKFR